MKKFFEDYQVLCDQTGDFYKNHWKGTIVMNLALVGIGIAIGYITDLKHKKEHEAFDTKHYSCDEEA